MTVADYMTTITGSVKMKTKTKEHHLKIISLFNARAICTCGEWNYTAAGEMPRARTEAAFKRHKESHA